jgi:membrane dipeptidase
VHLRRLAGLILASAPAVFGGVLAIHSLASVQSAPSQTQRSSSAAAQALHASALVVDLHADTVQALDAGARALGERSSRGHVDLPRLRQGGVDVQIFAIYVSPSTPAHGRARADRLIGVLTRQVAENRNGGAAGGIVPATTVAHIERASRAGKIASVLSIENGDALGGDVKALDAFYAAGVRIMSLTWNASNALGDGAAGNAHGGLTDLGRTVLRRMNALGIVVDVSHLSEASFWDALKVTRGALVASHSNASGVHRHVRNLTDHQLRAIARRGGVVGVSFVPQFLGGATLAHVLDHIDHMVAVMGVDHVALGSDFDGFSRAPAGIEDVSRLPNLTAGLLARGYSDDAVRRILGANALRVFRAVWKK